MTPRLTDPDGARWDGGEGQIRWALMVVIPGVRLDVTSGACSGVVILGAVL